MKSRFTHIIVLLLLGAGTLFADSDLTFLNLGFVSYDNVIPGSPGSPGVNTFNFFNFTGDPNTGGFALPPDFPSLTPVIFTNSTLTLFRGSTSTVISLGDIGPGLFTSSLLQFADTEDFSSAVFSAFLSDTNLMLDDGSIFHAASPAISATLLPSSGGSLVGGTDFAIVQVAATPEPEGWILLVTALMISGLLQLKKRRFRF